MENNFEEIIKKGALIIDVRTKEEFNEGHITGSLNIPLDKISEATSWLLKEVPIILVCASGSRSGLAKDFLDTQGYKEVYNGGAFYSLGNIKAGGCPIE